MEKIKLPWGELIIVGKTSKFSVGIDTIFPNKETDSETSFLKKGKGVFVVLQGQGFCGTRKIKRGDIVVVKTGQRINLKNNSSKNLKVITVYMPPYNEANIGTNK